MSICNQFNKHFYKVAKKFTSYEPENETNLAFTHLCADVRPCTLADYDSTVFHNGPVDKRCDYDSTESHNHMFEKVLIWQLLSRVTKKGYFICIIKPIIPWEWP